MCFDTLARSANDESCQWFAWARRKLNLVPFCVCNGSSASIGYLPLPLPLHGHFADVSRVSRDCRYPADRVLDIAGKALL